MDHHYAGILETQISLGETTQNMSVVDYTGFFAAKTDALRMQQHTHRQIKMEIMSALRQSIGDTPPLGQALKALQNFAKEQPGMLIMDKGGGNTVSDIVNNLCSEASSLYAKKIDKETRKRLATTLRSQNPEDPSIELTTYIEDRWNKENT